MEAPTISPAEPNHKTSWTESDQLDWDPEKIADDGYPLVDENGTTLVPIPREGPLDEDEASSLTAWAQGYQEVRKSLRDSVTGRAYYKPESSRHKENCAQNYVRKETTETRPKHHSETKREITAQSVSLEPN